MTKNHVVLVAVLAGLLLWGGNRMLAEDFAVASIAGRQDSTPAEEQLVSSDTKLTGAEGDRLTPRLPAVNPARPVRHWCLPSFQNVLPCKATALLFQMDWRAASSRPLPPGTLPGFQHWYLWR